MTKKVNETKKEKFSLDTRVRLVAENEGGKGVKMPVWFTLPQHKALRQQHIDICKGLVALSVANGNYPITYLVYFAVGKNAHRKEVFEDGPKRDRRMWLGDLYLQAKTNYATFHHTDLVKRCLYLFAGLRQNEGRIGATLFIRPKLQVDDIYLFDYALHFIGTLWDYYEETKDAGTLQELYPAALRQIEIAAQRVDGAGLVQDEDSWWCFVDWGEGLNKQCSAQAIFIIALRKMMKMAEVLAKAEDKRKLAALLDRAVKGSRLLYDEQQQVFVSGAGRQVSQHSQIWAVLADLLPREEACALLKRLPELPRAPQTPFMQHFYVEALLHTGMKREAFEHLKSYWGAMLKEGDVTYGEVFDPENPDYSPYEDKAIGSRCHAWSCTPSYFIRRHLG